MQLILAPGIAFMSRLRYAYKFGLISLFFVAPIVVLIYFLVSEVNEGVELAQKEQLGVAYLVPLRGVLENLQQHRGMAAALLGGDASFADKLAAKQKQLAELMAKVDAVDKQYGQALNTSAQWKSLKQEWQSLRDKVGGLTPKESFAAHTALIGKIVFFMTQVADASNLTLDPDIDSHYVMDALVTRLPAISEALGQARAWDWRWSAGRCDR